MKLLIAILGFLLLLATAAIVAVTLQALMCAREVRNPSRRSTGWALARGFAADPGEAGLPFDDWTLERADGIELPVWEIPAKNPSEESPILILLHGWGQSRIEMLGLLDSILTQQRDDGHERGFRTLIPELRGHGEATSGPTTLGQEDIGDVAALIQRAGPGRVILLGYSLGAVTAINTASIHPDGITSVLALAPYERLLDPISATLRSRELPHGLSAKLVTRFSTTAENLRRSTSRSAAALNCRLRVFIGAHDRIAPPETGRSIAESARRGSIRIIEDAGHVDLPKACASRLAEDLRTDMAAPTKDA